MTKNRRRTTRITGLDLARFRAPGPRRRRPFAALLLVALLAGLGLAALRIDILRVRYALAEAVDTERKLLEDRSIWTARAATLRDPVRLREHAEKLGFARATRVIELDAVRLASSTRP